MARGLLQLGRARRAGAAVALVPALTAIPFHSALAAGTSPEISASASPSEIAYGATLSVSGRIAEAGQPLPGTPLELQASPYPFRSYTTIAQGTSAPDGSFAFTSLTLDRDTHLRVLTATAPVETSPQLAVTVDPTVAINALSQGPGQTRLSIRVGHSPKAPSPPVQASWFLAKGPHAAFRLAAVTSTREISPGLTYASTEIDPPSKEFAYRVCLSPSWAPSMGHGEGPSCPQHEDGELSYGGEGQGTPLAPYPSRSAIAVAVGYLDGRAGRTSLAVLNSAGEVSGVNLHEHFETASVVKVMMLVAFLQMRSAEHRSLDAADEALLYPMIHISDNEAASAVYGIVGEPAVARVARESGMSDYAPGAGWWAYTQTSAADQARFFYELPQLIPKQFYAYARGLLEGIEPSQSWGVPPVARPSWQVFFKTGALPSQGLFNEVARLERPGIAFTVAVFTDGDPSMSYGEQTIEGVAAALLAHSPP
jgi:Beta-lactamase enzyme family